MKGGIGTIYNSLITPPSVDDEQLELGDKSEDAAHFQARQMWLKSTITQERMAELQGRIDSGIRESLLLVKSSPVNTELLVKKLVGINTLIEVLETYK